MPAFRLEIANSKPLNNDPYITDSIGEHGRNLPHDVAMVQTLLKALRAQARTPPPKTFNARPGRR